MKQNKNEKVLITKLNGFKNCKTATKNTHKNKKLYYIVVEEYNLEVFI